MRVSPKDVMTKALQALMLGDYGHDLQAEHFEQEVEVILAGLDDAGFTIVAKEPPSYMHSEAKANYRMNISVGRRALSPQPPSGTQASEVEG